MLQIIISSTWRIFFFVSPRLAFEHRFATRWIVRRLSGYHKFSIKSRMRWNEIENGYKGSILRGGNTNGKKLNFCRRIRTTVKRTLLRYLAPRCRCRFTIYSPLTVVFQANPAGSMTKSCKFFTNSTNSIMSTCSCHEKDISHIDSLTIESISNIACWHKYTLWSLRKLCSTDCNYTINNNESMEDNHFW